MIKKVTKVFKILLVLCIMIQSGAVNAQLTIT